MDETAKAGVEASAASPDADASRAPAGSSDPADRILTVPNLISLARLLSVPVFLWLLFARENRAAAAVVLGVLGATDWIDGYVARRFDQVSNLGAILDPVADRVVLVVGVLAIMIDGSVPVWFGSLTLVREVLISVAVLALAALGARHVVDVNWFGKAGTFGLYFAYPLLLMGHSTVSWAPTAEVLGWAFGIVGLVLAYYAAILYVGPGLAALREARAGSAAAGGRGA